MNQDSELSKNYTNISPNYSLDETLDFVCNEYVIKDKSKNRSWLTTPSTIFKSLSFIVLIAFIITFIPIAILIALVIWGVFLSLVFKHHVPMLVRVLAMMAFFLYPFALFKTIYFLLFQLKSFPTNLILQTEGISLAWKTKTETYSPVIPWQAIKYLSAYSKNSKTENDLQGAVILFDIDLNFLNIKDRSRFIGQSWRLWKYLLPICFHAMKFQINTLSLKFPLDTLTLEADKFRLLTALKSFCPIESISQEFIDSLESKSFPTFTQLWLDDMHSFRRTNLDELSPGTYLQNKRYAISSKIATGGQAKLYKAIDLATNSPVILKEFVLPINAGAAVRNRSFANVRKEALLLSSLVHPKIPKLLDNFVQDHRAYLVMEFIDGANLRERISQQGPLSSAVAREIALQICEVLSYLHSESPPIIHRDLSPDNILLTSDSNIFLLDFNVAQQLESGATNTVVGKHNYMPPEQFKGKATTQSDLYALGCTLFFILTGQDPRPLTCCQPATIIESINKELDKIVAKLTEQSLVLRYESVEKLIQDLRKIN